MVKTEEEENTFGTLSSLVIAGIGVIVIGGVAFFLLYGLIASPSSPGSRPGSSTSSKSAAPRSHHFHLTPKFVKSSKQENSYSLLLKVTPGNELKNWSINKLGFPSCNGIDGIDSCSIEKQPSPPYQPEAEIKLSLKLAPDAKKGKLILKFRAKYSKHLGLSNGSVSGSTSLLIEKNPNGDLSVKQK